MFIKKEKIAIRVLSILAIISLIIFVILFANLFSINILAPIDGHDKDWIYFINNYGITGEYYSELITEAFIEQYKWYLEFIFSMLFLSIFLVSIIPLIILFIKTKKYKYIL